MIRGLYVNGNTYTTLDITELSDNSLTDIFWSVGTWLLGDYPRLKTELNTLLGMLVGTNIKIHLVLSPFTDANNNPVDPTSSAHITTLSNAIIQVLTDYPNIEGISFDDFSYPLSYYDPAHLTVQQTNLVNFANTIKSSIKRLNNNFLFSAATAYNDYQAAKISLIAPSFDFLMPELYWEIMGYNISWLHSQLECYLIQAGSTPVVGDILTFSDVEYTPRTIPEIKRDIKIVLRSKVSGYALCSYPWTPDNLIFPNGLVNRSLISRSGC